MTTTPHVGDTITTAEQLDVIFGETGTEYVVVAERGWRPWLVTSTEDGYLYAWSWRQEDEDTDGNAHRTDELDYPLTLLALPPGQQPDPASALSQIAHELGQLAVARFREHGPHDARGAALWDASVYVAEKCSPLQAAAGGDPDKKVE